jgi:hypothetical protein
MNGYRHKRNDYRKSGKTEKETTRYGKTSHERKTITVFRHSAAEGCRESPSETQTQHIPPAADESPQNGEAG